MYKLIGLQEIAELLGVSQVTLRSWRHRNKLLAPDYVVSGNPVWEYDNFIKWASQDKWIIKHTTKEVESGIR